MLNPAFVGDVSDRWRPLSVQEEDTIQFWLEDAWGILQVDSPGLVSRIESGSTDLAVVVSVLCYAVIRKAKNPDTWRQGSVSIDDAARSFTLDTTISSGELYFTPDELRRVGGSGQRGRAFSITPS